MLKNLNWRTSAMALLAGIWLAGAGCGSDSRTVTIAPGAQADVVQATPVEPSIEAAAARQQPETGARRGKVVDGPSNLRNFSPRDTSATLKIPADQVNLRKIFEDLGPDATLWYQHVLSLSNPFFEGRAPGTRGIELTEEYIEFYFRKYDLEPAFPGAVAQLGGESTAAFTSFRQPFDFASPNPDVKLLHASASANGQALQEGVDYAVLGNSGNGTITGPVTFVGYAIESGEDEYTSFDESCNLTGRVALMMRYEPLDDEGRSRWSQARFSRHAGMAPKMKALADRGAAGIIMVNPPEAVDGKTGLESLAESIRFGRRMNVPVIQVSHEAAERILKEGDEQGRSLLDWRRLADAGSVKCAALNDSLQVSISASLEVNDRLPAQNVAAVLRGRGKLADQWIVIGGHHDHVGYGYTGTRPGNVGKLHPGADDNASGIASMLIAAKRMAQNYASSSTTADLRSIMFVGFSAEEAGLHGSRHFVENSPIPNESINLMLNMDMVGRLRNDNLLVQGTGTAENFDAILRPLFEASGLRISAMPTGRGPSDHSNFYGKEVPVLFLFTGEHADYHQPSDHGYTVNPAGAVKIIDLLESLAMHFAESPERLKYSSGARGGGPGRDTGARVTLGTIPDYTAELETGMRVEDVRQDSSADEAGIQGGDILLTWNGQELTGARRLAELLGRHEPGDRVRIVLLRGEKEMAVEVTLKARVAE